MAGMYAPKWLQVRRSGALEPCRESQYSPRPRTSGRKKSPDEKPDPRANLSRPGQVTKRSKTSRKTLSPGGIDTAGREFFCFFSALAQLLLSATKLTDRMVFTARKKGATPERRLKK